MSQKNNRKALIRAVLRIQKNADCGKTIAKQPLMHECEFHFNEGCGWDMRGIK